MDFPPISSSWNFCYYNIFKPVHFMSCIFNQSQQYLSKFSTSFLFLHATMCHQVVEHFTCRAYIHHWSCPGTSHTLPLHNWFKWLGIQTKTTSYKALVLSTLRFSVSESWSMAIVNIKWLEAAHHKRQRKTLGVTWRVYAIRHRTRMEFWEDKTPRPQNGWQQSTTTSTDMVLRKC